MSIQNAATHRAVSALIPAGGFSSRMHGYKPLLPLGNGVLIESVIRLFQGAGAGDILVVTGFNHEKLAPVAKAAGARVVFNPDYRDGMFSSIRAGARALGKDSVGFFLMPADIPAVRPATVLRILDAFRKNPSVPVIPEFEGQPGHPPLIPASVIPAVLGAGPSANFREVLFSGGREPSWLTVHDRGVLMDADTQEAYEAVREKFRTLRLPDTAECASMVRRELGRASDIRVHLALVEIVAMKLGKILKPFFPDLDLELIRAGALLHDIKRLEKNHDKAGEIFLRSHGFPEVAQIVGNHMSLPCGPGDGLTENEVVYFADKLCRGPQLDLDFERRFHEKADAFPEGRERILQRLETARHIQSRIESLIGRSVREILG